jgi:D-serine deaminase-like pyridoxal phosphate-dependent protein
MTTNYLVYRKGSNSANQSMCDKMPLCIVEAVDKRQATDIAEKVHSVYANQQLIAVCESKAKAKDWRSVIEDDNYNSCDEVMKVDGVLYSAQPLLDYSKIYG